MLISLECDVQWSTAYAESNSILSRRFAVYNCREHLPIQWDQSLSQVYLAVGGLLRQQQNCFLIHKEGSL